MVLCKRLHPGRQYFGGNVDKGFGSFHYLCTRNQSLHVESAITNNWTEYNN